MGTNKGTGGNRVRILLVEDAEDVAEAVAISFARRGDAVDRAASLAEAEAYLAAQSYDLAILDIELPDGLGTTLLRALRQARKDTLVVMLTARSEVEERVSALDGGADDYITKPFDLRELQARVRVLARRVQGHASPEITFGGLVFDPVRQTVTAHGSAISLTRRELALLDIMLAHRGWVVPKDRIFERMFSFAEEEVGVNAVELYMTRLRRKLEGSGVAIKTLRGLGYQLVEAP